MSKKVLEEGSVGSVLAGDDLPVALRNCLKERKVDIHSPGNGSTAPLLQVQDGGYVILGGMWGRKFGQLNTQKVAEMAAGWIANIVARS